jgi:hypothetical protein
MKRFLQPTTGLFIAIWLVLLISGQSRFFQDPGTFWHVKVGERIIDVGFFDTDPYTFSFPNKPWIPHQWLGECIMYVGHSIGGFDTLLLGTATLLAMVYTGLGMRLLRAGFHPSVVAVILAFGIAASSGHFHVRPHLATIACMAIFFVFLIDVENGRIPIWRLAYLVPVAWLWSNIHGGVLGGLATFGVAIAGWSATRLLKRESPIKTLRDVVRLLLIWLACAAVCFANPYFHRLPLAWKEIYEMSSLPTIIREHHPVTLDEWSGITVVGFGVLYCTVLLTVPIARWRVSWLLPVVWFALACMRIRHAPLFAVGALAGIADFFPYSRIATLLVRRKSDLYIPKTSLPGDDSVRGNATPFLIPAALVLLALVVQAVGLAVPIVGRGSAKLDPNIWPVEILPEVRAHQFDRPGGSHIFCEYTYGGYLILNAPGYRVFIDDRCEVFGDEFLVEFVLTKDMLKAGFDSPAEPFAEWQAKYGAFDLALVETEGGFDVALSQIPARERVKRTDTASLYRKVKQPNK